MTMRLYITFTFTLLFLSGSMLAQEYGKASYYDQSFQGAKTASGEPYDGNKYTAAHKLHPFGTRLRVTRVDNNRSVVVRVNDRGPHIKGRIVDLSYAAAKTLDLIRDGVVDVKVEVLSRGSTTPELSQPEERPTEASMPPTRQTREEAPNRASNTPPANNAAANANNQAENTNNEAARRADIISRPSQPARNMPAKREPTQPVTDNRSNKDYQDRLLTEPYERFGLYEIKVLQVNRAGFGVQVASLSSYDNALKQLTALQAKKIYNALLSIEPKADGTQAFKVIIGPYNSRAEAKKETNRLQRLIKVKGFVVDLSTIAY